jgi:hypothetical protein
MPTIFSSSILTSRQMASDQLVSLAADATAPAFLFLAACELAALIAIYAYRRKPHGKPRILDNSRNPDLSRHLHQRPR